MRQVGLSRRTTIYKKNIYSSESAGLALKNCSGYHCQCRWLLRFGVPLAVRRQGGKNDHVCPTPRAKAAEGLNFLSLSRR